MKRFSAANSSLFRLTSSRSRWFPSLAHSLKRTATSAFVAGRPSARAVLSDSPKLGSSSNQVVMSGMANATCQRSLLPARDKIRSIGVRNSSGFDVQLNTTLVGVAASRKRTSSANEMAELDVQHILATRRL